MLVLDHVWARSENPSSGPGSNDDATKLMALDR